MVAIATSVAGKCLSSAGAVLWTLADHQGTVRDLAEYDLGLDSASIANHRVYNAFGELVSETDDAVDHLFAYTGRERDDETGLQYHRARYYDPPSAAGSARTPSPSPPAMPTSTAWLGTTR